MKIIKKISKTKRIVFKKKFPYGWIFELQNKHGFWWVYSTHQYPSVMNGKDLERLEHQLLWQEWGRLDHEKLMATQKKIGKRIISSF